MKTPRVTKSTHRMHATARAAALLALPVCGAAMAAADAQTPAGAPETIVITGTAQLTRNLPVSAGSKIATDPLDTPHAVVTVPGEVLESQAAVTLNDAVRNVSGISFNSNLAGNRSNPMLRGFTVDEHYGIRVDGLYNLSWADYPLFNVEAVQVFKGGNAAGMGLSDPGGFINLITKKADGKRAFETTQTVNTKNDFISAWALDAPVTDALASHSVAIYGDGPAPYLDSRSDKKRLFLAENLMLKLGTATQLQVDVRRLFDTQNYGAASEIPALGNGPAPINIRTNMSSPADRFSVGDDVVDFIVQSELGQGFSLHSGLKYQSVDRFRRYLSPNSLTAAGILGATYTWSDQKFDYVSLDSNVGYEGRVAGMKTVAALGIDVLHVRSNALSQNAPSNQKYSINIYAPSFANFTWVYGAASTTLGQQDYQALYAQDELFLTDRLVLNVGARQGSNRQVSTGVATVTDSKFSPNAGLNFKPTPETALYADYATSFNPQTQVAAGYVPPQTSRQYEAGAKWERNGAMLNAAVYQWTMENIATPDPNNPSNTVYTGQVQTKGIELDASVDLSARLTLLGNAATTNARITRDNNTAAGVSNVGHRFAGVSPQNFGAWLMYHEAAWGAGLGVRHVSGFQGDAANDFQLPGYTVASANAYWKVAANARMNLAVENLFNKDYYAGATTRYSILQGTPLLATLSLNAKF